MSDKFPLESLLILAQNRTDAAARHLGSLLASEHTCQDQLSLIEGFRTEYRTQFQTRAAQGLNAMEWDIHARFMQRIDAAIMAQKQALASSQRRSAEGQRAWVDQHQQLQRYDVLAQRHQAGVHQQTVRREQKQTDEHAAQRHGAVRSAAACAVPRSTLE